MVPFALRSLLHDKIRLLIAVGGVSFSILLILMLRGIMDGTVAKATTYIDHVGADIFVVQDGVEHMALSTSVLPAEVETRARAVEGVATAGGIVGVPAIITIDGTEVAGRLVGFDVQTGIGGPWSMAKGTADLSAGDAVVDASMARVEGIGIGDTVTVSGHEFRVQGLSNQTNNLAGKIVFVRRDIAQDLIGSRDIYNYVLVAVTPDADPRLVAQRLRQAIPESSVMLRRDLARNERDVLGNLFVTPVNVMATIGLLVGLMVVGLTIYTAAAERLRDFGILKAIGAPNAYIYAVIVRQAVIVGATGFCLGLAAGWLAKPLVEYLVPDLGIRFNASFVLQVAGVALFMSLVAALLPVYRITGIDPKRVFKT